MAMRQPFPESLKETTVGSGPDFPGSSGDRERGKFRPSATPRLTAVAVTGDRGEPIAATVEQLLAEMILYQKAILLALSLTAEGGSFSVESLLTQVS